GGSREDDHLSGMPLLPGMPDGSPGARVGRISEPGPRGCLGGDRVARGLRPEVAAAAELARATRAMPGGRPSGTTDRPFRRSFFVPFVRFVVNTPSGNRPARLRGRAIRGTTARGALRAGAAG